MALQYSLTDSRVGRRILWLFLLAALVPSALLGSLAWDAWSSHRIQVQTDRLRSEAKFTGLRILDRLMLVRAELLRVADGSAPVDVHRHVRLGTHGMTEVIVVDRAGASLPQGDDDHHPANADWFARWQEHQRGPAPAGGARLVLLRKGGGADVVMQVTAPNGRGAAVARIDPSWLWSDAPPTADGSSYCLEEADGPRILCPKPEIAPVADGLRADGAIEVAWDLFLRHEFGARDWRVRLGRVPDGTDRAAEEAFGDIAWRVGLLSLLLVALLSLVMIRRTLKPLRLLTDATHRLAAGETQVSVDVVGEDELAQLGSAFNDMARQLAAQRQDLEHRASHDVLTGLLNRAGMNAALAAKLARSEHHEGALLLIDLDHFSEVNDTLGHECGDGLLQQVAARLRATVPQTAVVGRHGGDEFLVGVIGGESVGVDVASRLCEELARPFMLQQREVRVSASIGIACFPRDGIDGDVLLRRADLAMYAAKDAGRSRLAVFRPVLDERAVERHGLLADLRGAAARGEMLLHYQPRVDGRDGRARSVEALVRWRHPVRGLVPPGHFIGLAEETGLIQEIGAWVLDEGCRQMSAWRRQGLPIDRMSINVSVRQLRESDLVQQVEAALRRYALPAGALELEVTESVMAEDADRMAAMLRRVRELGVTLALDDFGTGYSSMSYLRHLPFDVLKIDRSFVRDLEHDHSAESVTRSIVGLAKGLSMTLVAEGVEDPAQAGMLAGWGVEEMQGFLFARPMPPLELEHWLSAQASTGRAAAIAAEASDARLERVDAPARHPA